MQVLISIYLTINTWLQTSKTVMFSKLVGEVFEARVVVELALSTRVIYIITLIILVYKGFSYGIYASKVG